MSIKSYHPSVSALRRKEWQLMRDAMDGEEAIKARGELYLTEPGGYAALDAPVRLAAYEAYRQKASFPNWLAPSVGAMIGIIHGQEIKIEMPDSLNFLWENADGEGLPLEAFHRRITRELLVIGGYGVLTDIPREGPSDQPYLVGVRRDSLINWDTEFFVIDESRMVRRGFVWEQLEQYRVLGMDGNFYTPYLYDAMGNMEPVEVRARGGRPLPRIPFAIGSAMDLSPRIEAPPLIGVAKAAVGYYWKSADQELSLYMGANPTLVAINGEAPKVVGAGVYHEMMGVQGLTPDLKYVEASNSGIAERRAEMEAEQQKAVMAGARLFEQTAAGAESGEAKKLRYASETATLISIAQNSCLILERALRNAAMLIGAPEDDINVTPPADLMDRTLSPQDFAALFGVYDAGGMSWDTYFANGQRGGIFSPDITAEDENAKINGALSNDETV